MSEGDGGNVIVDFLEWVYRHFFHDDWLVWAEDVCDSDYARKFGREKVPLEYLFRAFHESKISILREHPEEIREIKRLLRDEKDRVYPLRASLSDRELLRYP